MPDSHAERRAQELADVLSGRWYAESLRIIEERERLCRLCIRPRPRWLPDWAYRWLLSRLVVMSEFRTQSRL